MVGVAAQPAWRNDMTRATRIALAAAFMVCGTSFAMAQNGQPTGGYPGVAGGGNGNPFRPGINETTSVPSTANPYYGYYNYYGAYGSPYYVGPGYGAVYPYGYVRPGWR
jgi:hypothetical protein